MTIRYIHLRSPAIPYLQETSEHFGGITVAYELWTTKDPTGVSHLFANVALALCDHRDRYNKVEGRRIASERLRNRLSVSPLLAFTTHLGFAAMEEEVGHGVGSYMDRFYAKLTRDASGGIDVNEREIKVTKILTQVVIQHGEVCFYSWGGK